MKTTTQYTTFLKTIALAAMACAAALCTGRFNAEAKPISYVGGTMLMQENDETGYTLALDYTFNPHFALGLYSKYDIG
ncbi:MAG TPA: hypothetical protein VF511_12120, partial [Chthoniobacterales bacterium]